MARKKNDDFLDGVFKFVDALGLAVEKGASKLEEWDRKESERINNLNKTNTIPKHKSINISQLKYNELKDLKNNELNINYKESFLFYILGEIGTGKTGLALALAENTLIKGDIKSCYAIGFKRGDLPNFINYLEIENIDNIPPYSLIIVDEGSINLNARESMKKVNINFGKLLNIRRHLKCKLIILSQQSISIDVNVLRSSTHLFFKPFSLLQKDFERPYISNIYNKIENEFEHKLDKYGKELCYLYSKKYKGFCLNQLPTFWSDDIGLSQRK